MPELPPSPSNRVARSVWGHAEDVPIFQIDVDSCCFREDPNLMIASSVIGFFVGFAVDRADELGAGFCG